MCALCSSIGVHQFKALQSQLLRAQLWSTVLGTDYFSPSMQLLHDRTKRCDTDYGISHVSKGFVVLVGQNSNSKRLKGKPGLTQKKSTSASWQRQSVSGLGLSFSTESRPEVRQRQQPRSAGRSTACGTSVQQRQVQHRCVHLT